LGGITDIDKRILRHNSAFKDDPIRVLRLMRFKAKLKDFDVAPETQIMLNELLSNLDLFLDIPKERLVAEIIKGFNSVFFNRYINELNTYSVLENMCGIKILFKIIETELSLSIDEKIAISLSNNSFLDLEILFEKIKFPRHISSFSLNLKSLITLDLESSQQVILDALELIRWNDSDGDFDSYVRCLKTLDLAAKGLLLVRGREILKGLDLREIASEPSNKSVALKIFAAKYQALAKLL
jgi:tRNA nucleotidyltransferase/poly(A) polymerase